MKKLAFALHVFVMMSFFPVYVILELTEGRTKINKETLFDLRFEESRGQVPFFSKTPVGTDLPLGNYLSHATAIKTSHAANLIANNRHKNFDN
jgi:hypothetical protein